MTIRRPVRMILLPASSILIDMGVWVFWDKRSLKEMSGRRIVVDCKVVTLIFNVNLLDSLVVTIPLRIILHGFESTLSHSYFCRWLLEFLTQIRVVARPGY